MISVWVDVLEINNRANRLYKIIMENYRDNYRKL